MTETARGRTGALSCRLLAQRPPSPLQASRARRSPKTQRSMPLIGDTQRGDLGQGFDEASRTIHMPKASAPTLSPATAQTTEQAIERYDAIVAQGGWPQCRQSTCCGSATAIRAWSTLRARLVGRRRSRSERGRQRHLRFLRRGAVRRFQARHGLTVDGIIRAETLTALNVPAAVRLDQLKVNVTRLRALGDQSRPALRGVQHSGGAHRGDRERRRGVAPHRGGRQARPAVARHQQQDRRDQLQSVLDGAGLDRAQGPDPEDAGSAGLPHQQPHPHLRLQAQRAAARRRSTGTRRTRPTTRSSRIRATSIRSARSASISPARTASTCTTRR